MEDAAKFGNFGMRHWVNFDQAYMRNFFMSQQPLFKLDEVQREVNAAIAERNAALEEKKHANAERDSALLQRDIAYADRHAAIMERDNMLEELAMIEEDRRNPDSAAKMMQVVNIAVDRFPENSNLLCSSTPINDMDPTPMDGMEIDHIEGKLPQRRGKQSVTKDEKKTSMKRKDSGATSQPKKASRAARKKHKVQDQEGVPSNVEKIKREDDSTAMVLFESQIDMTSTPLPYCSCSGVNRQCYRWGSGGWQSSCCTNSLCEYPLPMSTTKRGSRVAGRKMSGGAFRKLLEKLAGHGFDIAQPINLKDHWAKHGTNRYIIVR